MEKKPEEVLEDLFEDSEDLIMSLDNDGNITYANRSLRDALGHREDELTGAPLVDILDADSGSRFESLFEGAKSGQKESRLRATLLSAKGEEVSVEGRIDTVFRDGEPARTWGLFHNLSRRKTAERALRESEERYRLLADTSLTGILVHDGMNILYINERATEIARRPREYFQSMEDIIEVLVPEERPRIIDYIKRRFSGEDVPQIYDTRMVRGDGEIADIQLMNNRITFGGKPAIMVTINDITERKRFEERLQKINAELEGYAHTVSHDLKNPIGAMMMSCGLLRTLLEKPMTAENRKTINEVLNVLAGKVRESNTLVEELLSLAESGQVPQAVEKVSIAEVVREILLEKVDEIEKKGVKVNVDRDLGTVCASPTHMYQLFSNLIGNAIRFNTCDNPEVRISHLGDDEEGGHRYLVRDNGPGIPPENTNRIFTAFFRGEGGGAGIGLATVEKIVEVHRGNIRAYNDGGACFEFLIRDIEPRG